MGLSARTLRRPDAELVKLKRLLELSETARVSDCVIVTPGRCPEIPEIFKVVLLKRREIYSMS